MREYVIVLPKKDPRSWRPNEVLLVLKDKPEFQKGRLNLVGGKVEANEAPYDAAIRELKEETGLDLSDVDRVSPPVYSSAGLTDESISYAFVWAKGNLSNQFLKDGEDIEAFLFTRSEASDLLNQKGLFKGAKMSAKLYPIISAWSVDGESYD